jgi:hypothetical protein
MSLIYLEARILNTLLGGLISTATMGLKSTASTIKGLFESSDEQKIENILETTIVKIKSELDFDLTKSK